MSHVCSAQYGCHLFDKLRNLQFLKYKHSKNFTLISSLFMPTTLLLIFMTIGQNFLEDPMHRDSHQRCPFYQLHPIFFTSLNTQNLWIAVSLLFFSCFIAFLVSECARGIISPFFTVENTFLLLVISERSEKKGHLIFLLVSKKRLKKRVNGALKFKQTELKNCGFFDLAMRCLQYFITLIGHLEVKSTRRTSLICSPLPL